MRLLQLRRKKSRPLDRVARARQGGETDTDCVRPTSPLATRPPGQESASCWSKTKKRFFSAISVLWKIVSILHIFFKWLFLEKILLLLSKGSQGHPLSGNKEINLRQSGISKDTCEVSGTWISSFSSFFLFSSSNCEFSSQSSQAAELSSWVNSPLSFGSTPDSLEVSPLSQAKKDIRSLSKCRQVWANL